MMIRSNFLPFSLLPIRLEQLQTALGQLLLHGHTGTTSASPVEVREIGDDSRLVAIFGCDTAGKQLKCTVLCCDIPSCSLLKSLAESMLKV